MSELTAVRRMLAALFLFGSLGTEAELVLLEHTEGAWQTAPLGVIGIGCLTLAVLVISPTALRVRAFQIVMALFIASGVVGIVLHYQGNLEFERELEPDAGGLSLFWEAMKGATPALAPGTMVLLGALGLTYAHRHPAGKRLDDVTSASSGELR